MGRGRPGAASPGQPAGHAGRGGGMDRRAFCLAPAAPRRELCGGIPHRPAHRAGYVRAAVAAAPLPDAPSPVLLAAVAAPTSLPPAGAAPSRGGGPSIPSQSRRAPASTAEAPSRRSPFKGAHSYAQPRKMPPSATRWSGAIPVTLPLPLCRVSPTLWHIQDRLHRRAPGSRQARGRRTCPSAPISPARCGAASCGTSWPRESGAPWP